MRRYKFLTEKNVIEALNRVSDAFLAAKDGNDVKEILDGLLTHDEKIRIGRRILIAEALKKELTFKEMTVIENVGYSTIAWVARHLERHPRCFELIFKRREKIEKEYQAKKYRKVGGSKLVFKKKVHTGLKRSDIKR